MNPDFQEDVVATPQQGVDGSRVMEAFAANERLQAIQQTEKALNEQQRAVLGNDELYDKLSTAVDTYTVEELKALTDEQVEELYTFNGTTVTVSLVDADRQLEFKRDFLEYMKTSNDAHRQMADETEKLNQAMEESKQEIDAYINQFGSYDNYVRETLARNIANAVTPEQKQLAVDMQLAYEDSYTLENLIEHYGQFSTMNTLGDYRSTDLSNKIFQKYMKIAKSIGVTTDPSRYDQFETNYLPEKYHKYPNLLLFIIFKYVVYDKHTAPKAMAVFLSNLMVTLKDVASPTAQENEDVKARVERFKEAAQKLLDLFY